MWPVGRFESSDTGSPCSPRLCWRKCSFSSHRCPRPSALVSGTRSSHFSCRFTPEADTGERSPGPMSCFNSISTDLARTSQPESLQSTLMHLHLSRCSSHKIWTRTCLCSGLSVPYPDAATEQSKPQPDDRGPDFLPGLGPQGLHRPTRHASAPNPREPVSPQPSPTAPCGLVSSLVHSQHCGLCPGHTRHVPPEAWRCGPSARGTGPPSSPSTALPPLAP